MNRATTTPIVLPHGKKPGWEFEEADGENEDKKSVAESCVLIHALRQSRDKWISSTFPRFSTKARGGKAPDQLPPPHTIQMRGKCDMQIGPHIFSETTFYEVHYLPSQSSSVAVPTYQPLAGSWQTKTPYGAYPQPSTAPTITTQPLDAEKTSPPLMTSLNSVTTITPALINQVNSAASSNPTLANLLQLAAAGHASPEQLKTLGLLIQSLAISEATQPIPPSLAATPALPPLPTLSTVTSSIAPIKEFDLVLEFQENPIERWVFPRGLVTCERTVDLPASQALSRTVIKACIPFSKPKVSDGTSSEQPHPVNSLDEVPQVATFVLEKTPLAVWDTISRWAGSQEKVEQNKRKLEGIKSIEHVYLGYQLSHGPLLTQLQVAAFPTFTMKSLKLAAASATRAKRKPAHKPPKTVTTESIPNPKNSGANGNSSNKRRRVSHPNERPSAAAPIQCVSCKNKHVPLILGGRFCRPCVEAGHAAPQPAQPFRFSSYVSTAPVSAASISTAIPPPPLPDSPHKVEST